MEKIIIGQEEIIIFGGYSAIHALCFDPLPNHLLERIIYLTPTDLIKYDINSILYNSGCKRIAIVVGNLFYHECVLFVNACLSMDIPLYYMTDNNLIELGREGPTFERYTVSSVRSELRKYTGVLVTSPRLKRYYEDNGIHDNVIYYGIILNERLVRYVWPPHSSGKISIGFMGGSFRLKSFYSHVFPALTQLSKESDISLIDRDRGSQGMPFAIISEYKKTHLFIRAAQFVYRFVFKSWDRSHKDIPYPSANDDIPKEVVKISRFDEFIRIWQRKNINIIVHPYGESINMPYKTQNTVIVAYLLGAVPIVGLEEAFEELSENDGVLKADKSALDWEGKIKALMAEDYWLLMRERLEIYCRTTFSGERECLILENILRSRGMGMHEKCN